MVRLAAFYYTDMIAATLWQKLIGNGVMNSPHPMYTSRDAGRSAPKALFIFWVLRTKDYGSAKPMAKLFKPFAAAEDSSALPSNGRIPNIANGDSFACSIR
jgi:hypothetical protein